MMENRRAGLLMYRYCAGIPEILLVHPGGPLYADKDDGYWSLPKGRVESWETFFDAAAREFEEETGCSSESDEYISLGRSSGAEGSSLFVWAFRGDCDTGRPVHSKLFTMEWPPHSGCLQRFPEVDRMAFFTLPGARVKVEAEQRIFIERIEQFIGTLSRLRPAQ